MKTVYVIQHPCGGIWLTTDVNEAEQAGEHGCIINAHNDRYVYNFVNTC